MDAVNGELRCGFLEQGDPEKSNLIFQQSTYSTSLVFVMASKTDYAAQFKELKDLIETANTNIKLLENRITTNDEELVARVCNVETQAKEVLDFA